jgi:hypothetical protein
MPYHPFDTGWIKNVYSVICLGWFLFSTGLLPRFSYYSCYNNICIPLSKLITAMCETVGNFGLSIAKTIVRVESIAFHTLDYVEPIYKILRYINNLIPTFDGGRPPSFRYLPSNIRHHKTSSGKHLSSYFARKRRLRKTNVINNINHNDNTNVNPKPKPKSKFRPSNYVDNVRTFCTIDDPSCQIDKWYDAVSSYWTDGMVWDGAYVLNNQVVSVNTDPVFVSNLLPALELSATIQTPEARSEDENVGPRVTIALDSGSSIHIFKDAFLLTNIHADENHSIGVRTTDSKFRINKIGKLCDDLNTLPLPSEEYYFYPKGVANLLSLTMIVRTKRVGMDTAIDDAF